jgi:hypothetical protein
MAEKAPNLEDTISEIALAWRETGALAPVAPAQWQTRCDIPYCSGLAFAALKTHLGQRCVCFRHYETIRRSVEVAPPARPGRRRRG